MIFGNKYNYLIPDQDEVNKLNLDRNYYKRGQGMQAQRRIFKNQIYDTFEMEKLTELKNALDSIPVEYNKNAQTDDVLLRFLYANRFDIHYTVQHFIDHLTWLTDPDALDYGEQIKEYDRFIQIIGRDDLLRPVIYIDLNQFKISHDPIILLRNLIIQLVIMEDYMFVPGKIESWIALFDPNTTATSVISYEQVLYSAKLLQINFPKCLERLYIIDAPTEFRTMYDKLKQDDQGSRVYSDELIAKTIFLQKVDVQKLQFSYFQWADIHKQKPQTKSEEVQTKNVRVFSQLNENEQNSKIHDHAYGDWHDCEHCQKRNLRFQTKINHEQDQAQQINQLGENNSINNNYPNNNDPNSNTNNNNQNGNTNTNRNNTIQGPLHPLIVYAYGAPEKYVPQIHDPLLTKQATLPNSVFLDYQEKLPLESSKYISQQALINTNQHQLSFNQNIQQQPLSQIATKPNINVLQPMDGTRTKYDDLIDQFGWNKYGVSQALFINLGQTVKTLTPQINIMKNEETLKKDEQFTPYLQQTYSSTPQKQAQDDIFTNSPNFEQYSEQNPKSFKIEIPRINTSMSKDYPIIDQQFNDYTKYNPNNQLSNKYEIPEYNQENYDTPKQYESYKSYKSDKIMPKYDIPVTKYDIPVTKYDIPVTKYDIPVTKYDIPATKYDIPFTKQEIPSYTPPSLNYEISNKLNNQFEYKPQLSQGYLPNEQQYQQQQQQYEQYIPTTNNYNFGVLPQRPTDQTISYQQPNQFSTINNKDDSQYIPNIVEQDGLKYQDETFIVGGGEGTQKTRKTMENDLQCSIF